MISTEKLTIVFKRNICAFSHIRWFAVDSSRSNKSIFERKQNNILCVATASDGKTMAVGTRTGKIHLWSTKLVPKPPLLKHFCRLRINQFLEMKRKEIVNLSISNNLINYLLYKDIQTR